MCLAYTYYVNLFEAIMRAQKLLQTCRESVALSHHVKTRFIKVRNNFCRERVRMFLTQ